MFYKMDTLLGQHLPLWRQLMQTKSGVWCNQQLHFDEKVKTVMSVVLGKITISAFIVAKPRP